MNANGNELSESGDYAVTRVIKPYSARPKPPRNMIGVR